MDETRIDAAGAGGGDPAGPVLTVVGRWDFHVTDVAAVLAAGQAAYRMNHADEGPEAGEDHPPVDTPERAAEELLEYGGVDAVYDTPGVEPVRVFTAALAHDEDDDAAFEADPFAIAYEDVD